jgi:hypothetical protein
LPNRPKHNQYKEKKIGAVFLGFLCLVSFLTASAQDNNSNKADSVINQLIRYRAVYENQIREYDAQLYVKGNTKVWKKNLLFRYAPDFFYLNGNSDSSFVESIIKLHYTYPDYFSHDMIAANGHKINIQDIRERLMPFIGINIYNPTVFRDYAFLPGNYNIFKYYSFEYIASIDTLNYTIHQVKIVPKIQSQKLISGCLYIVDDVWSIYKIDISGRQDLSDFKITTTFGLPHHRFLLPLTSEITIHFNVLGNEAVYSYSTLSEYNSIKLNDGSEENRPESFDLSLYYHSSSDLVPIIGDSLFWEDLRPNPLSMDERRLLSRNNERKKESTLSKIRKFSPGLFSPKRQRHKDINLYYSGFINPLSFYYSKMDGIVYRQQINFSKEYETGREFQFNPSVGLLLQRSEVYFDFPSRWIFYPGKSGFVDFSFRNDNKSFNSSIINQINKMMPDSINFDDFNIDYFKHYRFASESHYELANGLILRGGINYDWYSPVKDNSARQDSETEHDLADELVDWVYDQYYAFAPVIGLSWTPKQYYRFNGKKKEYVRSDFPTFSIEYARGIKGILGSESDYERIEIDIQQKIPAGLMRSFHYYLGAGWFTNTKSVYFADFKYFRKRNIPESWNDPIGGVFHLLPGNWYNASNRYIQTHFMYESPFALLRLFRRVSKDILQERIYLSQLYTPVLPSYTEIGYGFGNFLGNAGLFVSLYKGKIDSFGAKLAFDINR